MFTGKFGRTWMHRRGFAAILFLSALGAALLVANIQGRGDSKTLFAAALSAREAADRLLRDNRLDEAEQSYRRALEIMKKLVVGWSTERSHRHHQAELVETIGAVQVARDQRDAAESTYQQGIALRALLVAEEPASVDDRLRMAACINQLGALLREAGRWDEAEDVFVRGQRLCETVPKIVSNDPRLRQQLALVLEQLGLLLLDMGRRSEALESYASAVRTQRMAVESPSGGSVERALLVSLRVDQARLLAESRRNAEAERALVEAVGMAERLRADDPSEARYQDLSATALSELAEQILASPGRVAESREFLNHALAIREKLVGQSPGAPDLRRKLAATFVRLADVHRDLNSTGDAEASYRKGIFHDSRLSNELPRVAAYRFAHGQALCKFADFLRARGRGREALPIAREAVKRLSEVYTENTLSPEYRSAISRAYWTLCAVELDCGSHLAAALTIRDYLTIEPNGFEEALESARLLCRCIPLARQDSSASAMERETTAGAFTDQAIDALRTAVRNGFRDVNELITARTYEPLRSREDFQRLVCDLAARVE